MDVKVVIATDGSETAIDATRRSLQLLRPDVGVSLVMVIPEMADPLEDAGGIEGSAISEAEAEKDWHHAVDTGQAALDRTASAVGGDVDIHLIPADEQTGKAIVDAAISMEADVLVVGSAGAGLMKRLFGGSVSEYVLHHAPCPVLLVRHDR